MSKNSLDDLLITIRACRQCEAQLPLGPRPVLRAGRSARILIIGQAPGTKVHQSGIPWNDPSGDRLRDWMQTDAEHFYDEKEIAIIPMGFCYPGKGKSGDLPPRPECATLWHERLLHGTSQFAAATPGRQVRTGLLPGNPAPATLAHRAALEGLPAGLFPAATSITA